ncbi:MAG: GTPase HflX [Candidatus Methanomethyliaceae archaeon]|nr:GTPase HflX [Candidatus Methanomethyliaceae archaeon]MDW7970252.1 GTPase HflX [Nitrososphaerota archaeon]
MEVKNRKQSSKLHELISLSEAAGYKVIKTFQQNRPIDSSFCMGKGKAREVAKVIKELNPIKVIFYNQLKPIQRYNLTKLFGIEVIDRFQLILEIFTKRAGTLEAKYQIELAKLQYELPMIRENIRLAKLGELPGFHGLGKYALDVYESMIKRRISYLRKKLEEIRIRKSMHRRSRYPLFSIALTGYTFAGKTALFNRLTKENLQVGSLLFTTLSTTTRAMLISGRKVLISDTVGFLDDLPPMLIEAFYSTLEEVTLADLVLLILDASDSRDEFLRKLHTSISILNSIGIFNGSILPVMNKIDVANSSLEEYEKIVNHTIGIKPIKISALTGEGINELINAISLRLPNYRKIKIFVPKSSDLSSILRLINNRFDIASIKYDNDGTYIEVIAHPDYLNAIKPLSHKEVVIREELLS